MRRGAEEPVEVSTSGDGPETLERLLQDEPPEVAIVDWDLPGIQGPEMCRLLGDFHHGHDTWLIVLAGSDHRATGEAWRAGADDCVSTPAPAAELRACVEKGLLAMRAPWTPVDESDMEPEVEGPRATLDAGARRRRRRQRLLRIGRHGPASYGGAADYGMTADAETAAADEPRGAALLEAVLHELRTSAVRRRESRSRAGVTVAEERAKAALPGLAPARSSASAALAHHTSLRTPGWLNPGYLFGAREHSQTTRAMSRGTSRTRILEGLPPRLEVK